MRNDYWDERAELPGWRAVFSSRWSPEECALADDEQWRLLRELMGDVEGLRVLDLGCGVGRLSRRLAECGAATVGVDASQGMIDRAVDLYQAGSSALRFLRAEASQLPFDDADFDLSLAIFALQHIMDDDGFNDALREVVRVTRPGGKVITCDGLVEFTSQPRQPSARTRHRAMTSYIDVMANSGARLESAQSVMYVEDEYAMLVWLRNG